MQIPDQPQKVLLMGLGASGKSSIRSVVFEGKTFEDVQDYEATIGYSRTMKSYIDTMFQIFDCGGQESFISAFIGDQAGFIFSDVAIFIWVVDMSNFDVVSTSRFYFNHGVSKLQEYSPNAKIFCFFHKKDLVATENHDQAATTLMQFFKVESHFEINYRTTSIFDQTIYQLFGEMVQILIRDTTKAKSVSAALQKFLDKNMEISGIAIYDEEGIPIFDQGRLTQRLLLPAKLTLARFGSMRNNYKVSQTYKSTIETDNYFFYFQRLKGDLLFSGIVKKFGPLRYALVKMEKLIVILDGLLDLKGAK